MPEPAAPGVVSFVIATYGRPEVLAATLRTLTLQRRPEWEAVVVGDCCDARTESVVRGLGDPRVRYYNLPQRYGEQGGPNSVGLACARGDLVTFLNHDDLLLPDHLDHVVAGFTEAAPDALVVRSVKVRWFEVQADGTPKIVCGARVPGATRVTDVIRSQVFEVEPSSAWTVTRVAAERVGAWRSSQALLRLPFQDWLLRLARQGGRWRFSDRVTGLSLLGQYGREASEAADLVDLIDRTSADEIRAMFVPTDDEAPDRSSALRVLRRLDASLARPGLALYRRTGMDYGPLPARWRRGARGSAARQILADRTGEAMPDHSVLESYLADPEALRVC